MITKTVLAVFASSMFVFNLVVGAVLTATTGIPGASGLVTGLVTGIFLSLTVLWVPRWWSGAFVFGLYCFFAWVTPLMGPPGPRKILVGLFAGCLFSAVFGWSAKAAFLNQRISLRLVLSWLVFLVALVVGVAVGFELLNLPGKEKFMKAIWVFAAVFFVLGTVGVLCGRHLDNRYLVNTSTRKRVQKALE